MADHTNTTPGGAAAASATAHPDAELIAICDRLAFVQAEAIRRGDAVTDESDEAYAEVVHPIWAERDRLLDAIEPLRARTSDGIAARVRALAAANPVDDHGHHWFSFDGGRVVSGQLSWLLRDTAALDTSGNIVWKPPVSAEPLAVRDEGADAELLADCRALADLHAQHDEVWAGWGHLPKEHPDQIDAQARVDAYGDAMETILERLAVASPVSPTGRQARARVVMASIDEFDRLPEVMTDATADAVDAVLREAAGGTAA